METESFTFFRRMDMLLLVAYVTWPQLGGPRRATWGGGVFKCLPPGAFKTRALPDPGRRYPPSGSE